MKRTLAFLLPIALLLISAHRLPAPISEVETPAPTPEQSAKTRQARALKPKAANENSERPGKRRSPSPTPKIQPTQQSRFAGAWTGVMHTFPWGDIPQTITVDPMEATMRIVSIKPAGDSTVRAEQHGGTLTGHFGSGGTYSLTPLADGSTALVRLQAPFNDNTATYHRTTSVPVSGQSRNEAR